MNRIAQLEIRDGSILHTLCERAARTEHRGHCAARPPAVASQTGSQTVSCNCHGNSPDAIYHLRMTVFRSEAWRTQIGFRLCGV